jgi:hypothetical protein
MVGAAKRHESLSERRCPTIEPALSTDRPCANVNVNRTFTAIIEAFSY